MKVLMLNGSANANGNTNRALIEIGEQLSREGIEYEIFQAGGKPVRDCIACGSCNDSGCVFDDDVCNAFIAKAKEADAFVFGSPVYYAHPSGRILSILDRAFYSRGDVFAYKPAAAVAIARRGGTTATLDTLQKFFGDNNMPIVTSTYWNLAHGRTPGEVERDEEGMQTMRNIARNMSWILRSIEAGKSSGIERPVPETEARTHFIR